MARDNAHLAAGDQKVRIRTKSNLLPPAIDEDYLRMIHQLRVGDLDVEAYHRECLAYFAECIATNAFDDMIGRARTQSEELELLRRHLDDKRYTVLLYSVAEGEVHPPHHHHNVISTQIVVEGKIRVREYDRLHRDDNGGLILKIVSDRILQSGDWFQASEWKRNVHWFQAVDGPALIFNTNARGFEPETFDVDDDSFGRRYIDPCSFDEKSHIRGEEFDKAEAFARFGGRSMDEFPVPASALSAQ